MQQAAFLVLILFGVLALIAAIVRARLHWRPDIAPYSRHSSVVHLILHTDEYVRGHAVALVQVLNLVGLLAVAGALAVLIYKLLYEFAPANWS